MAPVTAVDGVCCFCKTSLSLTRPASQNKAKHLLGCCSDFQPGLALQAHWAWQSLPWQNVVSHGLQVVPSIATMPPWGVWLICHPMDVAQEAHFSNRDTLDSCQDGKPIRDVSTQSAKAPQSRGFLFSAPRFSHGLSALAHLQQWRSVALCRLGLCLQLGKPVQCVIPQGLGFGSEVAYMADCADRFCAVDGARLIGCTAVSGHKGIARSRRCP